MKITSVKPHFFVDYQRPDSRVVDDISADIRSQEDFRRNYYAFTCLLYHPAQRKIYCGTTNFAQDLLYTFDPETKAFESKNYAAFAEEYEIKIHRGLTLGRDGKIYAATSCLHDTDRRLDAPGGKVFRFDPETNEFTLLSIPVEHDYIQTITLDPERQMIYGMTYPVFNFFAYSIPEKRVVYKQYMGSITHIAAVDDAGGYWGTWGRRHNLFRYDPEENRVHFFSHGLPTRCESLMYAGAGPIDSMINGGDGFLYVGTEKAELYKIDPGTAEVTFLGKPFPANRMPGLIVDKDGLIYGAGGDERNCTVFSYDRKSGVFETLGVIRETETEAARVAANPVGAGLRARPQGCRGESPGPPAKGCRGDSPDTGRMADPSNVGAGLRARPQGCRGGSPGPPAKREACYRTHDLIKVGSSLYVGETDNPTRSAYLWECVVGE